jgi:hypothetical protein
MTKYNMIRNLAEEKAAVEIWRQNNVIEHQQGNRKYGRGANDAGKLEQRREPPFGSMQTKDKINNPGIDDDAGQQPWVQSLGELAAFETQQEGRQKRRYGGQEIVGHDHPLPSRQSLQSNHQLTVRPTDCFISRLSGGALSQVAAP